MEISFFTTNNKSGYKTREKWFSSNYPKEYSEINQYVEELGIEMSFKEKIYFFFNKLKTRPKCKTCGNEIKFRERLDTPYGDFCSLSCINENKDEMLKRQKKSFNKKYGVDFYPNHPDFVKKQKKTKKEKYGNENYNNFEKSLQTKQEKYGNPNFNNKLKSKQTSIQKYGVDNYTKSDEYKDKLIKKYKDIYPTLNFVTVDKDLVQIQCQKCNNISEVTKQLVYERNKRNYDVCVFCNPIGQNNRSGHEFSLEEFIKTLNIEYSTSNRKILNGYEVDFFFPENQIGIELNGVYWHNELFVESDYHLNKTIKANEKNIELLHFFEDEWLYKKDIVKSIIKNKIGQIDNVIYARKCVIKEVNHIESKSFLDANHIQGNVNTKVRLGLYYENNLISLMTFSKGRIFMGGKKSEWELNRFCNLINTNVIGGASKLFKYFLQNYKPEKIVSYSDIRIFNGNLYKKLGFTEISKSKPNYWYVVNGIRKHRFNYSKARLIKDGFDKNKTEKEIMFERKIYRIYDCGNIRWEHKNKL